MITSSPSEKKLQQEQKINKNKIKPKQEKKTKNKIKAKITSKNKETKRTFEQKQNNVGKQELTCLICRGTWQERQIDWIICRIYILLVHGDCIGGICNTWCENILIKTNLIDATMLLPHIFI